MVVPKPQSVGAGGYKNAQMLIVIFMACLLEVMGEQKGANDVVGRKRPGLVNNLNDTISEKT